MKTAVIFLLALAFSLAAQVPAVSSAPAGPSTGSTAPKTVNNTWQIKPQVISTTSSVDLCSLAGWPPCGYDVYVCWMDVNTGSTPTTITIADKQASPINFLNSVAIAANTSYSPLLVGASDQSCRWFPGGLTITAGNANALTIYMRGKWWTGPALF